MDELVNLRKIIDVLDDEIISLIAERQEVVVRVGKVKALKKIAVLDSKREELLKQQHAELAKKYNLSAEFVTRLFEIILEESRKTQHVNLQ
ncbi:MAG: pheA [Burkholderiales bacterium]|jgi:chorismate mutase/prephenate dehydratase|nr:pheA [Burkholderiales bacterium]MCE3268431.1 pheA [Burkholderiales bacterium]